MHASPAEAAKGRSLLVVGDSLTVGTKPYIRRYLRGWRVHQRVAISGPQSRVSANVAGSDPSTGATAKPTTHAGVSDGALIGR